MSTWEDGGDRGDDQGLTSARSLTGKQGDRCARDDFFAILNQNIWIRKNKD